MLLFEYAYDDRDRLSSCEHNSYDKDSGDGTISDIAFSYNDDDSLASLATYISAPFEYSEALWTFTPTGSTSAGNDDGREFVISYEANPQFELAWPQFCDATLQAPGSRIEFVEEPGRERSTTISYAYDGPVAPGTRTQIATFESGSTETTRLTYDSENRLVRLEREDGSGYEHAFDERGQWTARDEFGDYNVAWNFFYDPAGNLRASVRQGSGEPTHYFYTYECW